MNFSYSSDTETLVAGAAEFLGERCDVLRLRDPADGDDGWALWPELASMGLIGAAGSEAAGGLALPLTDVFRLAEEAGRVALPEPMAEVATVAVPLLSELKWDGLSALPAGETRLVVAHASNPLTAGANGAEQVLWISDSVIAVVPIADCNVSDALSIDPWRRLARLSVRDAVASQHALASGEQAAALSARAFELGVVACAAQLTGLAAAMINLATEYAKGREQFGVPIGGFQAVKHLLANAQIKLEFARPVVQHASAIAGSCTDRSRLAIAHAKVAAADAAILAAENSIQVYGGMGYTFEADLHYFMKRAWALAGLWGDREQHLAVIDDAIIGGSAATGPGATYAA